MIKCPTPGKLQSLGDLLQSTMTSQSFPLKSSSGNLPLSSYKLQDIHTLHVSCEIKAKVQIPQPFKHGYQISHPHENYDNQISSTRERKSVKCSGYPQKGEGRGGAKASVWQIWRRRKISENLHGGHTHSLCSRVLMLNPNVGSIVLISSPLNFFKIVVLPALSRPLSTVSRRWHQY